MEEETDPRVEMETKQNHTLVDTCPFTTHVKWNPQAAEKHIKALDV